jgi:hypothetical protein
MPDETTPIPENVPATQTGSVTLESEENGNRGLLRVVFGVLLGVLGMADVGMYSLHKAMESRVEAQDRRVERMDGILTDLLVSHDNASRIEEIEQQVVGIENQIGELVEMVRDNQKPPSEDVKPTPTK